MRGCFLIQLTNSALVSLPFCRSKRTENDQSVEQLKENVHLNIEGEEGRVEI